MSNRSNKIRDYFLFWLVTPLLIFVSVRYLLDPNYFAATQTTTGKHYLYTGNRLAGGVAGIFSVLLLISFCVTDESRRRAAYLKCLRILIPLLLIIGFLSGLFSAMTGYCWGLFETKEITDSSMLLAEYFWMIICSTLGPYLYYFFLIDN